ncbi:hypothetical protein JOB18_029017 [Solea senegalensis]|uniref:Formin 1 n=1 Tax=Solea senegalensis TaxID=28829 RepID=A0AAV6RZA7_SOLSE|nr:hypothetical protein JOB18_029017 [Solea senegalensis]
MEGTHAILVLYAPIHELCNISPYYPKRPAPSFKYKSRAPHSVRFGNNHDRGKEDLTVFEQRVQSSDSTGELLNSRQATKEAVAELCWLAVEHHQLLADLLSLCRDCASKVRMGNQDGKLQDYMEGQEVHLGGHIVNNSNCTLAVSPDQKKTASKSSKKLRKLGSKTFNSAEDFLHGKMKKKITSGGLSAECPPQTSVSTSAVSAVERITGTPASIHVSDSPATGSYVSAVSNPILPMEEPFQIGQEGWDFMDDNRAFDPDMYFSNDFSDCELGYESSSCRLIEGLTRRESGSNLRPIKRFDSPAETLSESASTATSTQPLCDINSSSAGVRVVAKVQDLSGKVQHVNRTSPDSGGPAVWGRSNGNQGVGREKTGKKHSGDMWLPLSTTTNHSLPAESYIKSPSSSSLAGIFNTSYPASNSLQSMSPVLSPLPSKQPSPQLNHRILLLSDTDVEPDNPDDPGNADEPRVYTEVIDRNGNKRTITRLDLNLSRRPSTTKWNSSSNSTTTDESLLRQDDIWMLDGDEAQEPPSRAPRPDHLDFLRITPPEDDIMGDTPYYPKLECTVRKHEQRKHFY